MTKKSPSKPKASSKPVIPDTKYKSAEYVNDSDDSSEEEGGDKEEGGDEEEEAETKPPSQPLATGWLTLMHNNVLVD